MRLITLTKWHGQPVHVDPEDVRGTRPGAPVDGCPSTVLIFDTETDERVRVLGAEHEIRKAMGLP